MIDPPVSASPDTPARDPAAAAPGAAVPSMARAPQPVSVPAAFGDWPGDAPWQRLPEAARRSFRLSALLLAGVISLAAGGLPLLIALIDQEPHLPLRLLLTLPVIPLIFGFALWRASVAYRNVRWRLDEDGLRVRRGRIWRSEVLVPRARVQHLDIERGPIERRYGLATLIVHTAGTRMNALRQPGFDEDTAARLRDALVPKVREVDLPAGPPPLPQAAATRSPEARAPVAASPASMPRPDDVGRDARDDAADQGGAVPAGLPTHDAAADRRAD